MRVWRVPWFPSCLFSGACAIGFRGYLNDGYLGWRGCLGDLIACDYMPLIFSDFNIQKWPYLKGVIDLETMTEYLRMVISEISFMTCNMEYPGNVVKSSRVKKTWKWSRIRKCLFETSPPPEADQVKKNAKTSLPSRGFFWCRSCFYLSFLFWALF